MQLPRADRFAEFKRRLTAAPVQATHDAARRLLEDTLNGVEDEFSGVPYQPENWQTDGRFYPPHDDRASDVDGCPDVVVYQSKRHETFIAANGAIEMRKLSGEVELTKPGADGKGVCHERH